MQVELRGWPQATLDCNCHAHDILPGNNSGLTRTMVATLLKSSFDTEGGTIESPFIEVNFREDSISAASAPSLSIHSFYMDSLLIT